MSGRSLKATRQLSISLQLLPLPLPLGVPTPLQESQLALTRPVQGEMAVPSGYLEG